MIEIEELSLIISVISITVAIFSVLLILLNHKLKSVEFRIDRDIKLLETCFGPLLHYFKQTSVGVNIGDSFIDEDDRKRYSLYFRKGLLEDIEKIWNKYSFEINFFNETLDKNIEFIISNISGRRSAPTEIRDHNFTIFPIMDKIELFNEYKDEYTEFLPNEFKIFDGNVKETLESWRMYIIDEIVEIKSKIQKRIRKNLGFKNSRLKMLFYSIWFYDVDRI